MCWQLVKALGVSYSRLSNIPSLNLDSIIWICGKYVRDEDGVSKASSDLTRYSKGRVSSETARAIASELLMRRLM